MPTSSRVKVGIDVGCAASLVSGISQARSDGFDFVIAPLVHPRLMRDGAAGVAEEQVFAQTTPDLLGISKWSRVVVGSVSRWAWRALTVQSSTSRRVAAEAALRREWEWASHLGLSATIATLPSRDVAGCARLVSQVTQRATSWQLWVRCGLDCEETGDPWERWDAMRRMCDHSLALCVALELGADAPSADAARRWRGEPIKALIVPTTVFVRNEAGFPVLPRAHQSLLASMAETMDPEALFIVSGRSRHPRGYVVYAQYIHHLIGRKLGIAHSATEQAELPYRDYLQAPLQPLSDDLEAQTYEIFERDPVKYAKYGEAIRKFLTEWGGKSPPVVAVVGAGRGPLIGCVLEAAKVVGVHLRTVYAVEKNVNALFTLRALAAQRADWREKVVVCAGDMRELRLPELADCLVSELLGSFGDNELSPECLDGAFACIAKPTAVSIPQRYQSFAQPISAARLWYDARRANTAELPGPPPALIIPGAPPPARGLETAFVVKLHRFAPLAPSKACFQFEHPSPQRRAAPNARYVSLVFETKVDATVHGLAGYFEATLYADVSISINPPTSSAGMFSWFPLFIPFLQPVPLQANQPLQVELWRQVDKHRVWYEWAVVAPVILPIQNPNGRSYSMRLFS